MGLFDETLGYIRPVSKAVEPAVRRHLDNLTKPPGSLGRLEELCIRYCLARNTDRPNIRKKTIVTFAADHGVTEEGVSAYPSEVTPQMVLNMLSGGAAINVLARHAGATLKLVDIGVDYEFGDADGLIDMKIMRGTHNIAKGRAMSKEEALLAIEAGISIAYQTIDEGADLLGTGDMGIGNTTASAALVCAYLHLQPEEVTGRGTGIDETTLRRKTDVIHRALKVNSEYLTDPVDTLSALGGLEIAGICGLILGASSRGIPTVIDGFISNAAALAAVKICPGVKDYLFFSHKSTEKGSDAVFSFFDEKPILDLEMRLGEGTGAALAMCIIDAAIKIYNEMATFDSAGVSQSTL